MKAAMFSTLICLRRYSDQYIIKADLTVTSIRKNCPVIFYPPMYGERPTEKIKQESF
jgi:hypothetical protein